MSAAYGYGTSYFVLKNEVRGRCTITNKDSANADALLGTIDNC